MEVGVLMQKIPWRSVPWKKVGTVALTIGGPIVSRAVYDALGLEDRLGNLIGEPSGSEAGGSAESIAGNDASENGAGINPTAGYVGRGGPAS
jgi:hypothetical protein